MLTRRSFVAAMPALAQLPSSPFERIDTHVHLNRPSDAIVMGLAASGWRVLSICVSRATGNDPSDLNEQLKGAAELSRRSHGRVAWAGSFDARNWQDSGFAAQVIADLGEKYKQGAIAIKIWKNIGMSLRKKMGVMCCRTTLHSCQFTRH